MPAIDQGARYSPIRWEDRWFRGEDKKLRFKVTLADDLTIPEDLETWTCAWFLREDRTDPDPVLELTGSEVTVVSAADPDDPETTINMVQVSIGRAVTEELKTGQYVHALVRTDTGDWQVLAEGEAVLRSSAGG